MSKLELLGLDEVTGISREDRETVREIVADIGAAADRIRRAGEKWVALTKATRRKVLEGVPATWATFLNRLELVGEHKLHPQLYAPVGRAARLLGKLPLEDQDRWLRELLPVVLVKGKGRYDVRNMDVEEMDEDQTRQVFRQLDDGTVLVRDVEAQKGYLTDKERREELEAGRELAQHVVIDRPSRWKLKGTRIYVHEDKLAGGLNRKDVELMIEDFKRIKG